MSEIYEFGPFRLDVEKRRLSRGTELLSLTPKAFDTLHVLVSRAGQNVEKDELLKAVWPDTFVEEGTLAQNISTLRRVLGDTFERPIYVATVPRRGYRFIETVRRTTAPLSSLSPDSGRTIDADGAADLARQVPPRPSRHPVPQYAWISLTVAAGFGVVLAAVYARRSPAPTVSTPVVFTIAPPPGNRFSTSGGFMAVSPDGDHIAFVATDSAGIDRLWLRRIDAAEARAVQNTEHAWQPFWSADSRFVAFFAQGKLKRVGVRGEPLQTICDLPRGQSLMGTWNRTGDILFPVGHRTIYRVPSTGGVATPMTLLQSAEDDVAAWPQFLADSRHFLYRARNAVGERAEIYVGSLDSDQTIRVTTADSHATFVSPGSLLFVERGVLWAQQFDPQNFRLRPRRVPIAAGVEFNNGTGRGVFSASQTGVVAYRRTAESQLTWVDRAGRALSTMGSPGGYLRFSVSSDGTEVAAARLQPDTGTSDIWVFSSATGTERRITADAAWDQSPVWSQDGKRILFTSDRTGRWAIYDRDIHGAIPEQLIIRPDPWPDPHPQGWTADGRLLLHSFDRATRGFWTAAVGSSGAVTKLSVTQPTDGQGHVSPDGRRLAYVAADAAGLGSVFLTSLETPAARTIVSPSGGQGPRWRRDGRELFYLSPDLTLMAVDIELDQGFRLGTQRALFHTNAVAPSGVAGQAFDASPDGQRFLVKVPASPPMITVVVNWPALIAAR